MGFISISGGGSIPSRSKGLTSTADTPEGHTQMFNKLKEFVAEWQAATEEQDTAPSSSSVTPEATPADAGGEVAPAE
jgi:hypothetical protein